ncbi:MFS general substrate transporter [Neoconidiobolus thromboides FSU 785]|nr:MFS general substrate transporter [Neoconidiobolus thromboides FSU 785]
MDPANIEDAFTINEKSTETGNNIEQPKLSGLKLNALIFGLVLSIFISSLDNTIVSTAMASIVSEFGALDLVTWVAASYLLTSTAFQPLYGKLSDIFGRKYTVLFALSIFTIGSIVCGAAPDMITLVIFRAISGIGGGGLYSLSVIIMSDIIPPRKRGMFLALAGGIFAIASIIGPLIGGAFTDHVTWRWAFYINIPICAITILVVVFFLDLPIPQGKISDKLKRIDFLGAFTLTCFTICLVLGLTWGGAEYEWISAPVIVTLVLAVVFLIIFVYVEVKVAKEPIVPGRILNRNTISAYITSFFIGALLMVSIYYLPIYYQVVKGQNATNAGLELLPLLLGAVACNFVTGAITTKTGKYRFLSIIAGAIQVIGASLFGALFRVDLTRAEEIIYALINGIGVGLCYQNNVMVAQAASTTEDIALSTSMVYFSNLLGGLFGLAIQGAVFNNRLASGLTELIPTIDPKFILSSIANIRTLSDQQQHLVFEAYCLAFKYLYLSMIPYAALSFISTLFLKHIPLKDNVVPTVGGH